MTARLHKGRTGRAADALEPNGAVTPSDIRTTMANVRACRIKSATLRSFLPLPTTPEWGEDGEGETKVIIDENPPHGCSSPPHRAPQSRLKN